MTDLEFIDKQIDDVEFKISICEMHLKGHCSNAEKEVYMEYFNRFKENLFHLYSIKRKLEMEDKN